MIFVYPAHTLSMRYTRIFTYLLSLCFLLLPALGCQESKQPQTLPQSEENSAIPLPDASDVGEIENVTGGPPYKYYGCNLRIMDTQELFEDIEDILALYGE